MRTLPLRLPPGCDLRHALETLALREFAAGGFVVCGIGSLCSPRLRLAGQKQATLYEGDHEILTLSGTVTAQGAHLHMAIASPAGEVRGGHVVAGNRVRTTVEVLLVEATGWLLSRERDAHTGFLELAARRAESDGLGHGHSRSQTSGTDSQHRQA